MPKIELSVGGALENREASGRCCVEDQYCGAEAVRTRRSVVHHNQIILCTIPLANVEGRCNKKNSQGNQDPSLVMPNAVVVDESHGNSREVAIGDDTESLDADTTAGPFAGTVGGAGDGGSC